MVGEPLEVLAHGVTAHARWFELWLRLVDDGSGVPLIDGIGRDITERREVELERAAMATIEGEWLTYVGPNVDAEADIAAASGS